jgi:cytochrome c-type biogenesis protein CcmH
MLIWVVMALMTGAAVLAVLWPLSAHASPPGDDRDDVRFYEDQLAEIARDAERGAISEADARAARTEAGRRLLRARATAPRMSAATGEPALRRRRAASAFALSVVPLIGLAVYGALGSPNAPARPLSARMSAEAPADLAGALARMEVHLAAQPNDVRGWEVIAPVYLGLGRADDAARAFGTALRLGGEAVERLTGLGEALVATSGGVVSAPAGDAFRRALALDPQSAKARFYLALAVEQDGDAPRAKAAYETLLASAPDGAPWRPVVQARLDALAGRPTSVEVGRDAVDLAPQIQAMVQGLDDRLRAAGGSEGEWARLVRSYVVLGRPDEARTRLSQARTALAGDPGAGDRLDRLASDLGLGTGLAER